MGCSARKATEPKYDILFFFFFFRWMEEDECLHILQASSKVTSIRESPSFSLCYKQAHLSFSLQ